MVHRIYLAIQHHRTICNYLAEFKSVHITGTSESNKMPFESIVKKFDIIVMTGQVTQTEKAIHAHVKHAKISVFLSCQILEHHMKRGSVSLGDISLLVFDECHLAQGNSPICQIMNLYLKKKKEDRRAALPQVNTAYLRIFC